MSELKHDKWVGTTYGNNWMHRWLIKMLRVIDVRLIYAFASVFVVPPTMIVNSLARNAIYKFYRKAFGYGRMKSMWMTYRNHCEFAQVVIDRFAMYAGKKFSFDIDGYDIFDSLSKQSSGFIQLSSHIGNYEIAGYSLVAKDKRFNAMVFGGEKESVMKNRSKMFDSNNIRMIAMQTDMSHLFIVDEALTNGEIISMPADRVFGSQKSFEISFFGCKARFPQGPFILAALRNVPMLFVSVMKTGLQRYKITVRKIETDLEGNSRVRAKRYASRYVSFLEETVKRYPTQWYNYFDFWISDGTE